MHRPATLWKRGLVLALLGAGNSLAQPDSGENSPDEVNVTARREFENRFQSTGSRVTIGRRDIESMGANSVGDILRQTPGLQVTTTANGGLEIRMRGLGMESTRILIDGVPVSTSNRSAQLPLDEMPADLIERIEVLRAPTAEFQGAAGGTLNIVLRNASSKRETLVWLTDQYVWGRHAANFYLSQSGPLGKSTAGMSKEEAARASVWSYFVSLTGGPRNLGSNTTKETHTSTSPASAWASVDEVRLRNNVWTFTPRLNGRLGANDRLTLRGILSRVDQEGLANSDSEGLSRGVYFSNQSRSPWAYERDFQQLGVDWSHSFKNAKLDTTLQAEHSQSRYRVDNSSTSLVTGSTSLSGYAEQRNERGIYLNSKLASAHGSQLWTVGLEYDRRKLESSSDTTLSTGSSAVDTSATTRRTALWSQYEVPVEGIKTTMIFGLRAQDYAVDASRAASPVSYQNLFWQPSFNSRTALNESTQLRFNLARISRNPRAWELLNVVQPNLSSNSPNNPDFQGNPNLRPYSTLTLDLGIDQRLKVGGQWGFNAFVRSQSDVIARRLFQNGTRWTEQPDNIGDAMIWGLESDIRTTLKWAGLGPDWTMSANATLLQSRMRNGVTEGERIPGQARYLGKFSITKPLRTSGGWYGGGTFSVVGPSEFNTASTPGVDISGLQRAHTQLDLYIGSVLPSIGFWRLNVYNVFDFTQSRTRVVADSTSGVVFNESFARRLTPRWFLTVGTRF